jgi:hypothetical protein
MRSLKKYGFRRASCALPECHRRMLVLNRKMDGDALSSRGVARATSGGIEKASHQRKRYK